MKLKSVSCVTLALLFITGCTAVSAGADMSAPSGDSLCEQSRGWGSAGSTRAIKVNPQVSEDDSGRSYRFDLGGRGGLQRFVASCGWGSYAECSFEVAQSDGTNYRFSEMSTFGLWETQQGLYLVYRIVAPKDKAAEGKRRVVKVGNPPAEMCNQIGDYSNLM
ncbi:hypothetical protein LYZ77_19045 [Xanthomonas hortorum pv. vitians]|uniref:hypothetical protein n=1 Tax=Xanthomonas hortorum TaxID=56454 RepID=UPI001CDA0B40|nr:hypothetical protein [Xanthomonas hortorum]MCE4280586.1 hypothetical protein [Xanthomonas hortorum pv. vitians]MCE4286956.1 hypothetical protein [Xanthomonas hortorum pv. vitians]MCE4291432.1 hypothetical protein [Xanthomonas hortorum pv. vitians]MCE4295742.1 hypothetical protein [Xanthomonas hortorum pv. vitians]MDT7854351.1 hypothetical protein [Xanthomonas hortorum pv. vitians]